MPKIKFVYVVTKRVLLYNSLYKNIVTENRTFRNELHSGIEILKLLIGTQ